MAPYLSFALALSKVMLYGPDLQGQIGALVAEAFEPP